MSLEPLSMFFDDDFEPSNYVDALFNSAIKSSAGSTSAPGQAAVVASSPLALSSQVYNEKTLHSLQNKCSNLVSHLDYYTNELFSQLSEKLETLKDSSSIVSSGVASLDYNDDTTMTRLQYYIKSMSNAVSSLQQEVTTVIEKNVAEINAHSSLTLLSSKEAELDPITKLSQLREVKLKLESVLDIFERIRREIQPEEVASNDSNSYSVVTIEQFTERMVNIHERLTGEAKGAESALNTALTKEEIVTYTEDLSSLLPLLQGTAFHPIFKNYISKILAEEKLLGRKN